ncbi:hypothetical protein SGLAM104S_04903 [Streptomyces glaucescens]
MCLAIGWAILKARSPHVTARGAVADADGDGGKPLETADAREADRTLMRRGTPTVPGCPADVVGPRAWADHRP